MCLKAQKDGIPTLKELAGKQVYQYQYYNIFNITGVCKKNNDKKNNGGRGDRAVR